MKLKTVWHIIILLLVGYLITLAISPIESTPWADAKREEGIRHQERESKREVAENLKSQESAEEMEDTDGEDHEHARHERRHRSKGFSMQRIVRPLTKEAMLMGVPFLFTLGILKARDWITGNQANKKNLPSNDS